MLKRFIIYTSLLVIGAYCFFRYKSRCVESIGYEIKNSKLPLEFDGFKILQISDLHNESFGINNNILINKIDELKPDIICITGDMIDGSKKDFSVALNLLDELSKKYKVYHIIGNHEQKVMKNKHKDIYKEYFAKLNLKNIVDLKNEKIKIERNGQFINLYGLIVPYKYYPYLLNENYKNKKLELKKCEIEKLLGKINPKEYNVLLSHNPFFFEEYSKWGADLVLSGHVHGGIIRLPLIGGVLSPNRQLFPKYDLGEYNMDKATMILTKGLGGSKLITRINCNPEIVSIILKNK